MRPTTVLTVRTLIDPHAYAHPDTMAGLREHLRRRIAHDAMDGGLALLGPITERLEYQPARYWHDDPEAGWRPVPDGAPIPRDAMGRLTLTCPAAPIRPALTPEDARTALRQAADAAAAAERHLAAAMGRAAPMRHRQPSEDRRVRAALDAYVAARRHAEDIRAAYPAARLAVSDTPHLAAARGGHP